MNGVDTSAAALAERIANLRTLAIYSDADVEDGVADACDLIAALAAERDALRAALAACEREREAGILIPLALIEAARGPLGAFYAEGREHYEQNLTLAFLALTRIVQSTDPEGGIRALAWAQARAAELGLIPPSADADEVGP